MSLQVWLPLNGSLENKGLANLTLSYNTISYINEGKIGKASSGCCEFHNSTDYVRNSWSLTCWCKSTQWSQYNDILMCNNNTGSNDCKFYFSIINGASLNLGINGPSATGSFAYTFATNTWYHVAATYDGLNYALYINGDKVKTGTCTTAEATGKLNLGINCRSTNSAGTSITGGTSKLNDVRIYNHCLSDKEVKEISKGLALHYKLDDGYVESTTNLFSPTLDTTCNSLTGFKANQNATLSVDIIDNNPAIKSISNQNTSTPGINLGTYILEANTDYTFSCILQSNCSSCISAYTIKNTTVSKKELPEYTALTFNSGSNTSITFYVFMTGMSIGEYVKITKPQLELKDHSTPYTPTSRTGNIVYDNSGYGYNGTTNGVLTINNDSAKYSKCTVFDGNTASITLGNLSTICPEGNFTFNCWIYKDGTWSTKSWETILGGPSGFELETKYSGINSPVIVNYSWGKTSMPYSLNEWTMITMTRNSSETKYYINGSLAGTGTAGTIPSGNYFIGAWSSSSGQNYKGKVSDVRIYNTVLSESDIKELYETSASIDKNGNLYCRELVEV